MAPNLVTLVVGAGPAGLLFCNAARIMFEKQGGTAATWPILLFDKRATYQRSHRLRMESSPVIALQRDLSDPRFDSFVEFLQGCHFSPAVNELEQELAAMAQGLGVAREHLEVGNGSGQVPVGAIRAQLQRESRVSEASRLTIVGADSVHSSVREAVRGNYGIVEETHQTVARLKVLGQDLPPRLGPVDRYRVSKVLGSIVDYRLNPNGFAEVDVFLPEVQHRDLQALGATPAASLSLTPEVLKRLNAPLFERLVQHLRSGLTQNAAEVQLQSTFRLEHRFIKPVTYDDPSQKAYVFLVGDAAISLPFFRGMACLVKSVHSLATVHCDLAKSAAQSEVDHEVLTQAALTYEKQVEQIRKSEVAIVEARSRLVRGAREFARVSSLLPFPLQTWFLSIPNHHSEPGRMSAGAVLNMLLALASATLVVGSFLFDAIFGWWGVALQAVGGFAYRTSQEFEPPPDALLRRIWLAQILGVFILGSFITITSSVDAGHLTNLGAALLWLALGYVFVVGMLGFEFLGRRLFYRAGFEEDTPRPR